MPHPRACEHGQWSAGWIWWVGGPARATEKGLASPLVPHSTLTSHHEVRRPASCLDKFISLRIRYIATSTAITFRLLSPRQIACSSQRLQSPEARPMYAGEMSPIRRNRPMTTVRSCCTFDISFTVIDIRGSRGRCKMGRRDSLLNVEALIPVLASGRSENDRKKCISFLAR